MDNFLHICQEIKLIAPTLAAMERKNSFLTPNGYFETAATQIIEQNTENNLLANENKVLFTFGKKMCFTTPPNYFEQLMWNTINTVLPNQYTADPPSPKINEIAKTKCFTVPKNYFETLEEHVLVELKDQNEDSDIAIEQEAVKQYKSTQFILPDNYFEQFESNVLAKIKDLDQDKDLHFSTINQAAKNAPFTVPENYFTEMKDNALTISQELSKTPILLQLLHTQPFTTPPNYFNQFPQTLLQKATQAPKLTLIKTNKRSIWQYASIAAVLACVAFGIYTYNNPIFEAKATISHAEIMPMDEVIQLLRNLSPEEAALYLNEEGDSSNLSLGEDFEIEKTNLNNTNLIELQKQIFAPNIDASSLEQFLTDEGELLN